MVPSSKQYFDTLQEIVAITDEKMMCKYVNPAFCDIFGGKNETWVGTSFHLHERANCEFAERPQGEIRKNSRTIVTFTHRSKPVWVEWLKTEVDDHTFVFTGRNITGRKHNETQLKELAKAANEASETKMRFLATMSHEMRTPLNGILGMTGLLLDTEIEPNQRAYADAIRESGSALLSLINDLLDYSKVESGKLELENRPVDLRALVQGVFELLSPRAMHKGLEVATYIAPQVPLKLWGDEGRIRQVLLNLVGNAIKFTESGGVTLEVYAAPSEKDGHLNIRMQVQDTGTGIAEAALEKIFDEFAQADNSHARKYEGTGLGLAIARRISQAMNGDVSVNSTLGQGSTFSFSVPLRICKENQLVSEDQYIHDNIIVLTKSHILTQNLQLQLAAVGVQNTTFVKTPTHCEQLLRENPGSTLLCDFQLATLHGKKLANLANHAIVMLSPMARGRLDAYRKIGFGGYLIKPIRQESLREWLTEKSPLPRLSRSTTPDKATAITPKLNRKLRLLLAEDNKINALLATAVIKQAGHQVDVAVNGVEALEQVQIGDYDLILMDMRMPEMDGLEATRQIRKLPTTVRQKPIIALTANAMKSDRKTCLAAGMNDFLTKPFNPEDLIDLIEKWVLASATHDDQQPATQISSNLAV